MREEYLANLDRFERIIPSLFDNRFRVERMRTEDIQEVVIRSAEQFGIDMPDSPAELASNIVENIRNDRGFIDLANLQVYLDRLYRDDIKRRGTDQRTIHFDQELLDRTGKLDDVLARFLDEQLQTIDNELRRKGATTEDTALTVLAQLVTNQATKQPRLIGAVVESLSKEKQLRQQDVAYCVERLEDMRIIRYL
jgi:hypothetical protein